MLIRRKAINVKMNITFLCKVIIFILICVGCINKQDYDTSIINGVWWFIKNDTYYEIYYNENDSIFDTYAFHNGVILFSKPSFKWEKVNKKLFLYNVDDNYADLKLTTYKKDIITFQDIKSNTIVFHKLDTISYSKKEIINGFYERNPKEFYHRMWLNQHQVILDAD